MKELLSIALILAHPDDESFIPSGTIAKYAESGVRIIYICATCGELGKKGHEENVPSEMFKKIRCEELMNACNILGIDELYLLGYPDGYLSDVNIKEPIYQVVKFLRQEQPDIIITFDSTGVTNHLDHLAVHKWVTHSYYLCSNPFYKTENINPYNPAKLYYLTVPSHHLISISDSEAKEKYIDEKITTIINVKDYLQQKRRAIECHKSQCFNIRKIFKFAGGIDELERFEYYILVDNNLNDYCYEIVEDNLLGGLM